MHQYTINPHKYNLGEYLKTWMGPSNDVAKLGTQLHKLSRKNEKNEKPMGNLPLLPKEIVASQLINLLCRRNPLHP